MVDAARGNRRLGDTKRGKQGRKSPRYTGETRGKGSLKAKKSPLRGFDGEYLEFCDTLLGVFSAVR